MQTLFARPNAYQEDWNPFKDFSADKCCHVSAFVHLATAMIVAYNLVSEMKWMKKYIGKSQIDFSMKDPPE